MQERLTRPLASECDAHHKNALFGTLFEECEPAHTRTPTSPEPFSGGRLGRRERVPSPAFIACERTRSGVRRALLFSKAILQAEFAADREVLASKRERWRAKRVARSHLRARNE
jgi:hypothetical protein